MTAPTGSFESPDRFMKIERVQDLTLSPAGDRLVATVSSSDDDGGQFVSALWALDPAGDGPARQLTRSAKGESGAAFLPDGSLLFVSSRPRPADGSGDDDERPALWVLPAAGGEPWLLAAPPGGVGAVLTGAATPTVVITARSAPGAATADEDRTWWTQRRKRKVSAVLHQQMPVRHWDHHVGPHETHIYAVDFDPSRPGQQATLRDLTPDAGQALARASISLTPDGATVLADWLVQLGRGKTRNEVVAIEVASGARRTLAGAEDGSYDFESPEPSPTGRQAVAVRTSKPTVTEPWTMDLWVIDLETGAGNAVSLGDGPNISSARFDHDGSGLLVTADWHGHRPLYRVDLSSGQVGRLTREGAWSAVQPTPDGGALVALRSSMDEPPRPVHLRWATSEQRPIDAPGEVGPRPGRLEEITATAADGTALRAYLVLPEQASPEQPAPLILWVHGGPVSSWNEWHWRWNPWLLAARGWAVLLPDPALSTGYGQAMIRRGWGQWGGAPYDDVMRLTDAALNRSDLDATRTAMMGGSYGGYMANWIAGHTTRFSAIVSHASLWSLEQFQGTTDWPESWADEWGYPETNPELYRKWSPDRFADAIRTPMLLIHGEHDYRCPVGESLRMWSDLTRRGVDCQFLWFGDENHWILQPGDATVWYETVFAFLEQHLLGHGWRRPELL
jgi:dipeptidyl aminopeptidase/acylaminoacyl peptidase